MYSVRSDGSMYTHTVQYVLCCCSIVHYSVGMLSVHTVMYVVLVYSSVHTQHTNLTVYDV